MDPPSPNTSRVTPCLISLRERPSAINEVVAQLSMLINPGETAMLLASISSLPRSGMFGAIFTILSPCIAKSAG